MPFIALAPLVASVVGVVAGAEAAAAVAAPLIAGISAADIIGGTLVGTASGALLGGVTGGGQGALKGAIGGALTGGALSFAPAAGAALGGALGAAPGGFVAGAADVAAAGAIGAGAGVLGSEVTGGKPLAGLESGAAAGLASGLGTALGPTASSVPSTAPAGVGPGSSPATTVVPGSGGAAPGGGVDTAAAAGDLFGPNAQGGSVPGSSVSSTPLGTSTSSTTAGPTTGGPTGTNITQTPSGPMGPGQATIFSSMATNPTPAAGDAFATAAPASPWSKVLGSIEDYVTSPKNLIQAGIGGAGLLMNAFGKSDQKALMAEEQQAAAGASTMARALDAPLFSGVLPPGAQQALDVSASNQKAQVRSTFASMGMAGSTSEADALDAVDQQTASQRFGIENNLFGQAAGYAGMAADDYRTILQQQREQDADFSNAISRFMAAISGGIGGTKTAA